MVGDEAGPALGDPPLVSDLHQPELPQPHYETDLLIGPQEAMVGDHENRSVSLEGSGGERSQYAAHAMVHVLESPVRLRGPRTVEVLEAIGAEEVHEKQVGGVAGQHAGRPVRPHLAPEKTPRALRPHTPA